MYALQCTINNRRLVNLELHQYDNAIEKNFIAEIQHGIPFDLIQIDKTEILRAFHLNAFDIDLTNCTFWASLQANKIHIDIKNKELIVTPKEIIIEEKKQISYEDLDDIDENTFKPIEEEKITSPQTTSFQDKVLGNLENEIELFVQETEKYFSLKAKTLKQNPQLNQACCEIEIRYANEKGTCNIHLASSKQFIGVALDFGSEASQMAVKRYSDEFVSQEKKPEIENLFRNMYGYHVSKNMIPRDNAIEYYQEDKGTKFYKSIFFVKKELEGDYDAQRVKKSLIVAKENMKMMVNTKDKNSDEGGISSLVRRYHQLPNLKIIHKHHDILSSLHFDMQSARGQAELSLGDVKNWITNSILRTLIASFLNTDYIKYPDEKRFLRMVLLIPNIYDSQDVQNVQQNLNELLQEIKQDEFPNLFCWEVSTISESDASFIGYIGKNNLDIKKGKDYAIIDVGKGTTDFSIVRTGIENLHHIEPIYRNGFAGAGNLITFSIFETLLHFIRENGNRNDNILKYIEDVILKSIRGEDLFRRTVFYNEIERLKRNFKIDNIDAIKVQWQRAKVSDNTWHNMIENNMDFNEFIKLLQEISFGADFYNYVNEACHAIVEKTLAHLRLVKENKKDFQLEGVILTGRTFLFEPLKKLFYQRLSQDLQIDSSKIKVLEGNELKEICIKGVFNNSVKLNNDLTGYPIQLFKNEQNQAEQEKSKTKKTWSLRAIILNDLERFNKTEKHIVQDSKLNSSKLLNSHILIGSKYYAVQSNNGMENNFDSRIDFTTQGYRIRQLQQQQVKHIGALIEIPDYDVEQLELIVPSLFPMYMHNDYIASINKNDIAPASVAANTSQVSSPTSKEMPNDNPLLF